MDIVIALAVNVFTALLKKYVEPKFGKLGVQAVVFLLALVGAVGYAFYLKNVAFQAVVLEALRTITYAITIYEIILKRISFFGGSVVK